MLTGPRGAGGRISLREDKEEAGRGGGLGLHLASLGRCCCLRCLFSEIPVRFPCHRDGRESEFLPQTLPLEEAVS